MHKIIEKMKSDSKYSAKIQLLLYSSFVVLVAIFVAIKSPNNLPNIDEEELDVSDNIVDENIIKITDKMNYQIKVNVNDSQECLYKIAKDGSEEKIIKEKANETTNYIFKDGEFYKEINGIPTKVTKDDIFDIIDYDYLKLDNINLYLSKATKNVNKYLVYLKDIILTNSSNNYFVIMIDNKNVSIDYTPLMKIYNDDINKCKVNITFEE